MQTIAIKGSTPVLLEKGRVASWDGHSALPKDTYCVDAGNDCVVPGLIDFHVHVFQKGSEFSVPADVSLLPQGITSAVDGGSTGSANYEALMQTTVANSTANVMALMNVSLMGQPTLKYGERLNHSFLNMDELRYAFENASIRPVGLKLRMGKESAEGLGIQPLKDAIAAADELGVNLVVHASDPEVSAEAIADLLRPGDVFCHCFHAKGPNILDEKGHVSKTIWEAKKRGVLFDAANGKSNFAFCVAEPALAEGFYPDIISTDLTCLTIYKDYSFGLPYVMAKYVAMGMPWDMVLKAVTETPAKWLGKADEIGTLKVGARGDVAVFRWKEMPVTFRDARGDSRQGNGLLIPQMTVKDGIIVYRQPDFALV